FAGLLLRQRDVATVVRAAREREILERRDDRGGERRFDARAGGVGPRAPRRERRAAEEGRPDRTDDRGITLEGEDGREQLPLAELGRAVARLRHEPARELARRQRS